MVRFEGLMQLEKRNSKKPLSVAVNKCPRHHHGTGHCVCMYVSMYCMFMYMFACRVYIYEAINWRKFSISIDSIVVRLDVLCICSCDLAITRLKWLNLSVRMHALYQRMSTLFIGMVSITWIESFL